MNPFNPIIFPDNAAWTPRWNSFCCHAPDTLETLAFNALDSAEPAAPGLLCSQPSFAPVTNLLPFSSLPALVLSHLTSQD